MVNLKCSNCGAPISKGFLCGNCYLESVRRRKERQQDIHRSLENDKRRFLYGG